MRALNFFGIAYLLLQVNFVTAAVAAESATVKKDPLLCQDIVENFCQSLWEAPKFGNMDLPIGQTIEQLRFGRTENDLGFATYSFFDALRKHTKDLPEDIQKAFKQTEFKKELDLYLNRKKPTLLKLADISRPEFVKPVMDSLENTLRLVSWQRTEAQHPGYINLTMINTSTQMNREASKNMAKVRSELFVTVWKNEKKWHNVKDIFEQVRQEYIQMTNEDKNLSDQLKKEILNNLVTVKLSIPGENLNKAVSQKWQKCGINEQNAVYSPTDHDITVCAGDFTAVSPLITVAHETGHSFSLSKRLQDYWVKTDYGQSMTNLWDRIGQGKHLSCDEWQKFKTDFSKQVSAIPAYKFEDTKFLETFLTKKLDPVPAGDALTKLSTKLGKATLRREVNGHYLENILKPEEILTDGSKVKNFRYLNPTLNWMYWPQSLMAIDRDDIQFELFFSEEYACQLQKNINPDVALKESIEQATKMITKSWSMFLTVPGKFSDFQEARDEEFAQDIEEDVVDAMAGRVVARLLKKVNPIEDRRNKYLGAIAGYCDEPSFDQQFPNEAYILNSFSNKSHSRGLDRRKKMLTSEIRQALECK